MDIRIVFTTGATLFFGRALSGCSTVAVHSSKEAAPPPYAGTNIAFSKTKQHWNNYDYYGEVMFTVLDVPFSFLADTLLYPMDVYKKNNDVEVSR